MLYLHTRDTKLKSQTHSSCIDHMIELQIQTHSLCIKCTHELQIQTHSLCIKCTHELQIERKKVCHCKKSSYELCNDKRQTKKLFTNQPKLTTLRVVFLYIGQLLLTTESKQLDISHMSTHPQEPIITHHGYPTDVEYLGPLSYSPYSSPSSSSSSCSSSFMTKSK